MSRIRVAVALASVAVLAAFSSHPARPAGVTTEVIAVYVGSMGTDAQSGMFDAVRNMKSALLRQTAGTGRTFTARGVSLEPVVEEGLQHLARFTSFDEVSVGGNWTNSSVVTYLGPDMSNTKRAAIPQIILLEREVRNDLPNKLTVGPEREIGRYIGVGEIAAWVKRGAPLPR